MKKFVMQFDKIVIFLLIFIRIEHRNCISFENSISHPIKIRLDFTNIPKKPNNEKLKTLIKESRDILENLLLVNKVRKIKIDEETLLKRCDKELNYTLPEFDDFEEDIIIFVLFNNKKYYYQNFYSQICKKENDFVSFRNVALFKISKNFNIKRKLRNSVTKNILKLEILRTLTDCLGLTLSHMENMKQPKNNFFQTPKYFLENSYAFNSIKKIYNLLGLNLPDTNISVNGHFYSQYWNKSFIVKDFRSKKIEAYSDISEISINLFNDIDFYSISPCDFIYDTYGNCLRFDKKCISNDELNNTYFLQYGYNEKNKLFCYLSNSNNLKNKQCGNFYGNMLRLLENYCPLVLKDKIPPVELGKYEIPEIEDYKSQTLTLLVPPKQCKNKFARTVYLKSEVRSENETEKVELNEITLNENQKKYFVTYQMYENIYYPYTFIKILNKNGLIRSYVRLGNHNFIKNELSYDSLKGKDGEQRFNKYQKIYHLFSGYSFGNKGSLDINYKSMRKKFPNDYNFMQETYEYPENNAQIKKKFKNYKINEKDLWLVKPKNGLTGRGIYFYGSRDENKLDNCIISKYLSNPHLLNGKKYDLRIYVLITGVNPLRIYLYKEGLVRISARKYSLDMNKINDTFIHLTNTGINSKSEEYIFPKNSTSENANKWNLKTYQHYLERQNINYKEIREKIADIIIKTIICCQHLVVKKLNDYNVNDRSFFKIFGFDVLLDDELEPHLLEVNTRPDMHIYDKMDSIVKQNIFVDSLNLVGITPFSHEKNPKSFDEEYQYSNPIDEAVEYAYCELMKPRGDFELIFPLKENIDKYRKFFVENTETNEKFWKKIKEEE